MSHSESATLRSTTAFVRVAIITGLILLIPLIAMQFTDAVNWNIGDFVIMGAMLFTAGSAFVLISRRVPQNRRLVVGVVLAILFLWLWAELAVGIFTNWGD